MDLIEHFQKMFAYDDWANRECIAAAQRAGSVSDDIIGRIAHILSAEKLWLERLRQEPQTLPVWPKTTIPDCLRLAEEMAQRWKQYLAELSAAGFTRTVDYRNTKGEPWSNRIDDILHHVLFHSAYHRGQIALQMRAAGFEPALTDFIHAVRQDLVK
jgi:uncharacterized damage-inducible protein DinB